MSVKNLKKDALKALCEMNDLDSSGKKSELIERLEAAGIDGNEEFLAYDPENPRQNHARPERPETTAEIQERLHSR